MARSPRTASARTRGAAGSYPSGNGVIPAGVERMAFENPLDPQPGAFERAVALDGLVRVARARRLETTLGEDEMRQRELVATNESHYDQARESLQPPQPPQSPRHVSVSTAPVNSARSTANEAV